MKAHRQEFRCYKSAGGECQKAIEAGPTFGNPYNDIGAYLSGIFP